MSSAKRKEIGLQIITKNEKRTCPNTNYSHSALDSLGITNLIFSLRGLTLISILTKTLGANAYGVWSEVLYIV